MEHKSKGHVNLDNFGIGSIYVITLDFVRNPGISGNLSY